MPTQTETMSISGVVRGYDRAPIHMIAVSVYHDTRLVAKEYTAKEYTDDVRQALRQGDLKRAAQLARVFKLTPITVGS